MLSMHFISLLHSSLRGALDACGAQGVQSRGCPPPPYGCAVLSWCCGSVGVSPPGAGSYGPSAAEQGVGVQSRSGGFSPR